MNFYQLHIEFKNSLRPNCGGTQLKISAHHCSKGKQGHNLII